MFSGCAADPRHEVEIFFYQGREMVKRNEGRTAESRPLKVYHLQAPIVQDVPCCHVPVEDASRCSSAKAVATAAVARTLSIWPVGEELGDGGGGETFDASTKPSRLTISSIFNPMPRHIGSGITGS